MLDSKQIEKVIFFDIESTSQYPTFKSLPERLQKLFAKRFKKEFDEIAIPQSSTGCQHLGYDINKAEDIYSNKAPLFAEWGRVLCISMGLLSKVGDEYQMKIVTYSDDDEKVLLEKFLKGTSKITDTTNPEYHWCGHNANNFDIPFITKRIILNKLLLPKMFDSFHLKPWERTFIIDTKVFWQMGVYDHNVSLDMLCEIFGVASSKSDMDGSEVKDVFWVDKDLSRIVRYCELDILSLAKCYLKIKNIHNLVVRV